MPATLLGASWRGELRSRYRRHSAGLEACTRLSFLFEQVERGGGQGDAIKFCEQGLEGEQLKARRARSQLATQLRSELGFASACGVERS